MVGKEEIWTVVIMHTDRKYGLEVIMYIINHVLVAAQVCSLQVNEKNKDDSGV
jgi:hypothetical protein